MLLREYETLYILRPDMPEEGIAQVKERLDGVLDREGAKVLRHDLWGKKKLAYPIKQFLEGHYVLIQFRMSPESGKQLEVNLKISEDVMRHLLINLNAA